MSNILKEAAIQVGSGGTAGFVEVCIMHPLDLVKTRLQLQNKMIMKADPQFYNGIVDCLLKMYKNEGLGAFWKGIVPPILVETPKRAVKFFTFEQYKQLFLFGHSSPTPVTYSLAGLSAGITESILVTPFEVVKVALQANRSKFKETPSTVFVARQIILKGGLGQQGLFKGLSATIHRNGLFNMVYFGFYHSVKDFFPSYENEKAEFFRKLGIGFVSGTLASCVNIPFDVAKSRIQGPQPQKNVIKYKTTYGSIATVYKEEGYAALYKGLLPKILRLGPGGAIMLLVYEYMHDFLSNKFK
ncbi:mitochondrial 2-oxodicarboxylate carrier-like [Coccinella septempunctata]|uniref:mitochondrial 2-oxodicarboxylate carrier-like n=1 Tax=Coccinella septempunctata TaxID=41139 RepID=UPI001D0769B8|nr:mitochondrial 2-oxodicarboxylate carrier-like [Coccinella septempunctata]